MNSINDLLLGSPREKKGPNEVQKMTKDELAKTLLKKKECNRKALEIVEQMLHERVEEEWFIKNLPNIRQNHFQDIIEERSILKLCGYPLCSGRLGNITPHKYHISAKLNKVYDTAERKKFCRNICYMAGMHLDKQLLTSPLWFTDNCEVPKFELIVISHAAGHLERFIGDEISFFPDNLLGDEAVPEPMTSGKDFVSSYQFAEASLQDMRLKSGKESAREGEKNEKKSDKNATGKDMAKDSDAEGTRVDLLCASAMKNLALDKTTIALPVLGIVSNSANISCSTTTHEASLQIIEKISAESPKQKAAAYSNVKSPDSRGLRKRVYERSIETKRVVPLSKTSHVETCLSEWCTLETSILLLGEANVKQMFEENGKPGAKFNEVLDHRLSDSKFQEQYEKINKRLRLMEIEDMQFDGQLRGTPAEDLKPLPSYADIQDVSRKMELKVSAFYEAKTAYVDNGPVSEPIEPVEENLMPLVDNQSQKTLRRKIVLDQLNRILPNILRTCGFTCGEVSRELRALVYTFSLDAHNISFKPVEWNLLGFVVLKMLSLRDANLKSQLSSKPAEKFETALLRGFSQDIGYVEKMLESRLCDVDNVWNKIMREA